MLEFAKIAASDKIADLVAEERSNGLERFD